MHSRAAHWDALMTYVVKNVEWRLPWPLAWPTLLDAVFSIELLITHIRKQKYSAEYSDQEKTNRRQENRKKVQEKRYFAKLLI